MTNEELITDLKQFITATVSQATADLTTKDDLAAVEHRVDQRLTTVEQGISTLDQKLDHVQEAIADVFTETTELHDAQLKDHERRLRKLEHRAA